jgi:signal transduction histidine kinase
MAVTVSRFLQVFQVETDRRIEEMERDQLLAADRERIGRELHDGIIQNIYASGLRLEETGHLVEENPVRARQQIGAVMTSLNRTIQDIRNYIFDLRAQEQGSELEGILEELVQDLRLDTLLDVDLEFVGQRCCTLGPEHVSNFTQIAREALSNVVQHAGASQVSVRLAYQGDKTLLTVTDDGQGLAEGPQAYDTSPGHGISNMLTRARMMGADLSLENRPGGGLGLVLTIPCGNEKAVNIEAGEHVLEDIAGR